MLYFLILILGILGIIIGVICNRYYCCEMADLVFSAIGIFFSLMAVILIILIGIEHATATSQLSEYQQTYNLLTYQLENNLYDNDNDYGKKELYNQIQEYNEDLAYRKSAQRDFWLGIFYSNIYDDLEFIELRVKKNE